MSDTMKTVSIKSLNARADHARGHEIELEYPEGAGLGVYLTVLGDQAEVVEAFEVSLADKRAQQAFEAAKDKSGKSSRSTADSLRENIERAAARVTGWRGLDETYDPELLLSMLERNPDFVDQVLSASRKRANFTRA